MVDWSAHDAFTESTIECRCGVFFRSHSRWTEGVGIRTRKPCPGCGSSTGMRAARSDPETIEYTGEHVVRVRR